MDKRLRIVRATLPDIKEMQHLFVDTIYMVCGSDYNSEQVKVWASSVHNAKRWRDVLLNQDVLLAKIDMNIVGFATLKDKNYLDLFYVHKDYQGQKIARTLYDKLEKEALRCNQPDITSDVSITARFFFEKIGFTVLKKQAVVRQGVEFTNFKMRKLLS